MEALTKGCIQSILNKGKIERPVLKVLNFKEMKSNNSTRYRLHVTDGVSECKYVMLATQLNGKVTSNELKIDSIIRVDNYDTRKMEQNTIIVILDLTVLDTDIMNDLSHTKDRRDSNSTSQPVTTIPAAPIKSSTSIPINLINNYQNKWEIIGRVTQKAPMKTYNNAKGEGKLFNFVLCDSSCDIKITAFNNEATNYYDMIQIGKTYSLSKGNVKVANKTFNKTGSDYEITLSAQSEILEIADRQELPKISFEFVGIDKIAQKNPETLIDIVGVAHSIMETTTITSKATNRDIRKRDVILVDRSGSSIRLTIWSDSVDLLNDKINPVIVVKGATVKEFNGKTLSSGFSSTILINPFDIPEAMILVGWYEEVGSSMQFQGQHTSSGGSQGVNNFTDISKLACDTNSDKPGYFTVNASISAIKRENLVYKACTVDKCNKKLVDQSNGLYMCEKCHIESPNYNFRLIMNMNIIDHGGSQWVTCFQEVAERILGKSATEIGNMVEFEETHKMNAMIKESLMKTFQLKLRVKNETYNDETRMKATVLDGKEIDYVQELSHIMSLIKVKQ